MITNNRVILANSIVMTTGFKPIAVNGDGKLVESDGHEILAENEALDYPINNMIAELASENYIYYTITTVGDSFGKLKVTAKPLV